MIQENLQCSISCVYAWPSSNLNALKVLELIIFSAIIAKHEPDYGWYMEIFDRFKKKILQKYEQVACCPISRSVKQQSCIEMRWRLSERGNKIKHCGKRETAQWWFQSGKFLILPIFCTTFSPVFFMKIIYTSKWWNIVVKVYVLKTFLVISRLRSGIQYMSDGDIVLVNLRLLRWGHYCPKRVDLITQTEWVFADMRSNSITASDVFGVCLQADLYISNRKTLWRPLAQLVVEKSLMNPHWAC